MKFSELDGIGAVTEKKLANCGIIDTVQLFTHSPPEISDITGMDGESSRALFAKVREKMIEEGKMGEKTGNQIKKERETVDKTTTGTKALDKLFGGGIEAKATTEIYGEFGCGKTQFVHTMAVRVQLPKDKFCPNCKREYGNYDGLYCEDCEIAIEKKEFFVLKNELPLVNRGGLDGKCYYMDTEGTFRPERIEQISEKLDLDPDETLENIIVNKIHNSAEQYIVLQELENRINKLGIKMIIVDSSTGLYRSDYIGRGRLSDRQGQLNRFVTLAKNIAENKNCAVILTNQVMKDPNKMFGDPTKPIGGDIYAHSSTYRVYFRKSGKNRVAKMVDSPNEAEIEVIFALNERGVVDPEIRDEDEKEVKKAKTKAARARKKIEE